MMSISEFFLLGLSLGTLKDWSKNINGDPVQYQRESNSILKSEPESKSLYDLMVHFPKDEDIVCPESDARMRYPGECSRYVTCRAYQAHVRLCPPGMYFDESYGHCRLSFEVDCKPTRVKETCGANEEYSDCGCEVTCQNIDDDDICINQCDRGCFCRSGYVRDEEGDCVEADSCENSIHSILKNNMENYDEFA